MPTVRSEISVAAGATEKNILNGTEFATLPYDAYVSLYATQEATGLLVTLRATGLMVMDEGTPNVDANGVVNTQQDGLIGKEPLPAGTALLFSAQNPTAGNITLHYLFDIQQA